MSKAYKPSPMAVAATLEGDAHEQVMRASGPKKMARKQFKFYRDTYPIRTFTFMTSIKNPAKPEHAKDLEQWLKEQFNMRPVHNPGNFPEKENGVYLIRFLKDQSVFHFICGQWWYREGALNLREFEETEPSNYLSLAERNAIKTMVKIGRREWLTPAALDLLSDMEFQSMIQGMRIGTKHTRNRIRDIKGETPKRKPKNPNRMPIPGPGPGE